MFNEFEKEDDQWRPDPSKAGKAFEITKKVLKWAFAAFIILFIGFLILRMCTSNPPSSMENVVWNDKLLNEYSSAKSENREFDILKIPTSNSFSEDGFYSIYEIAYCPQAKQLQFTVRSNNRALNYLEKDYKDIKKLPESYAYSITVSSAEESHTVSAYSYTSAERFGYTYRRLIFENIDLTSVTSVKLNIACSPSPSKTLQQINIYNNSVYKNIDELPYFSYKAPKKVTDGIKSHSPQEIA